MLIKIQIKSYSFSSENIFNSLIFLYTFQKSSTYTSTPGPALHFRLFSELSIKSYGFDVRLTFFNKSSRSYSKPQKSNTFSEISFF